jgi:hypothetical protein
MRVNLQRGIQDDQLAWAYIRFDADELDGVAVFGNLTRTSITIPGVSTSGMSRGWSLPERRARNPVRSTGRNVLVLE